LEIAEAEANRLKNERKSVGDDLSELEDSIEQEKDAARKEKKRLTTKIQELTERLNAAPTGDANAEDLKKLEEQVADASEDLAEADAAKSKSEKLVSSSTIDLEDFRQQLDDALRNINKQTALSKRLETDLVETNESIQNEKVTQARLKEALGAYNTEAAELRKRVAAAALSAGSGADSFDYRKENNRLKKDVENIDRENRALDREIRSLKDRLADAQYILDQERGARQKLSDTTLELKKSFTESERINTELIHKIQNGSEQDKSTLESEVAELEEKNKELRDQLYEG